MSWYIKKTSGLGNAVPTDGATYFCTNGRFSNVFDDRKSFSRRRSRICRNYYSKTIF